VLSNPVAIRQVFPEAVLQSEHQLNCRFEDFVATKMANVATRNFGWTTLIIKY